MSGKERRTLAIAAGGTAGHVMVALAIADAFERLEPGIGILFLGGALGTESNLVAEHGRQLELLPAAPLKRQRLGGRLASVAQTARGVLQARRILHRRSVRLVLGTGGYACFGPLVAARSLRLATAIHEANASPGLANRLLGKIVERVYLSSDDARSSFAAGRSIVTGTPLRGELARMAKDARQRPPITDRAARVLVTAGSEGSRFLDREAPQLLGRLAQTGIAIDAMHQSGHGNRDLVREAYASAGIAGATVVDFIDDMAKAYEWADLAIAGCGASTVAEIAAVALPSILVPIATVSDDHQRRNADAFARAGGITVVGEDDWQLEAVAATAARLLRDNGARAAAATAIRRLARPDAAEALARDCLAWLDARG